MAMQLSSTAVRSNTARLLSSRSQDDGVIHLTQRGIALKDSRQITCQELCVVQVRKPAGNGEQR